MDEYTFKHCPKGHYYQGEECPYCKAQATSFNKKSDVEEPATTLAKCKLCPRSHAYIRENCCPYCGETKVIGYCSMITAFSASLKIIFNTACTVRLDDACIKEVSELKVNYLEYAGHTTWYHIEGFPSFNYKSIIEIRGIKQTGKEFVNMVDLMRAVKAISNK